MQAGYPKKRGSGLIKTSKIDNTYQFVQAIAAPRGRFHSELKQNLIMHLQQIDVTGCRLVGAITKELGMDGPKHHAIVLGKNIVDDEVYIVELMRNGPQISTFQDFRKRYAANGQIRLESNNGPHENVQVAQRAIEELKQGGAVYDLVINNCESFVNRAMHGKSTSSQVINTALGVVALIGLYYVLKNSK